MNKSVFFDLDDTLVHKTSITEAKAELAEEVAEKLNVPLDHVITTMDNVDSISVKLHGFSDKNRLGASMAEGVKAVSTVAKIDPLELGIILDALAERAHDLGLKAITSESKLLPGVMGAIAGVRAKGYKTFVVTKGSYDVQNKAISDNKLDKVLDGVFVFNHKTLQEMYQVLMVTNSSARASWFVGNSPKSDVNPAYRAGMNAIYIPHETTWSAEIEDVLDGIITVNKINEINNIIV